MEHDTTPEKAPEPTTDRRPPRWRRAKLIAACAAVALPVVGLATYGIAGAESSDDSREVEVTEDCSPLTPEEVTETNDEQDALAAFLRERGIAHTRETDEDGIRWVTWDETDDEANAAADQFYAARYPMSPEEVAAANEHEDALAAFLDERGIAHTRQTDAHGVNHVVWDENDEAAGEALTDFFTTRYPTPPEVVAQLTAQEDELAAFLDSRGVHYLRETDPDGVSYVVWDDTDEAANAAVEEFYESQGDSSCVGMVEVDPG